MSPRREQRACAAPAYAPRGQVREKDFVAVPGGAGSIRHYTVRAANLELY